MEKPVFIFAAGWRTGSTLLQRIVNASQEVFIWGEPRFLNQAQQLHARMTAISRQQDPEPGDLSGIGSGAWIPTVFPGEERVRDAFTRFFQGLYAPDAAAAGYARWGFKEVRPGAIKFVLMLREIFPGGRFVFLVRHPLQAYHSLRNMEFYRQFKSPYLPASAWGTNAAAFLDAIRTQTVPAILVRYEDLAGEPDCRHQVLDSLCRHLDIKRTAGMDRELEVRTGRSNYRITLTPEDIAAVRQRTEQAARECGYEF